MQKNAQKAQKNCNSVWDLPGGEGRNFDGGGGVDPREEAAAAAAAPLGVDPTALNALLTRMFGSLRERTVMKSAFQKLHVLCQKHISATEQLVTDTLPNLKPAIRLSFGSNVVVDLFAALTAMFDPSDAEAVGDINGAPFSYDH